MQKTKDGYRWTMRLSCREQSQKEVIRMFEYLLSTGDYATESDIFREGIRSLYMARTESDREVDWDNRIQACANATADKILERMQTIIETSIGKVDVAIPVSEDIRAGKVAINDIGMAPPKAMEEITEDVDDFLSGLSGFM